MLIFYVFLSSCLAVLPPGSGNSRPADTTIQVQVSPNPSYSGEFYVEMEGCHPEQWIQIRVLDVIGRPVMRRTVSPAHGSRVRIDLRHLPRGMYMLEATQGRCKQVRRLRYQ